MPVQCGHEGNEVKITYWCLERDPTSLYSAKITLQCTARSSSGLWTALDGEHGPARACPGPMQAGAEPHL